MRGFVSVRADWSLQIWNLAELGMILRVTGKTCLEQNSPLKPPVQVTCKSLVTKFVVYVVKTNFSSSLITGKGWKISAQTTPAKLFQFSTGKTILQICQNAKMCEAMQTKATPPKPKSLVLPKAQWSSLERALTALTSQLHHFSWHLFFFLFHKIYRISHRSDVFTKINHSLSLQIFCLSKDNDCGWLFLFLSTMNSDTAPEANYIRKVISILRCLFLMQSSNYIYSAFITALLPNTPYPEWSALEQFRWLMFPSQAVSITWCWDLQAAKAVLSTH